MVLEWFFFTIFSAIAYSALDITEKHLISKRIPSALMLAIFIAIFYPINLAIIPVFFEIDLSFLPSLGSFAIGAGVYPSKLEHLLRYDFCIYALPPIIP